MPGRRCHQMLAVEVDAGAPPLAVAPGHPLLLLRTDPSTTTAPVHRRAIDHAWCWCVTPGLGWGTPISTDCRCLHTLHAEPSSKPGN